MWSDRTLLRPVTNREDLLTMVSLFDDDTGDAIDLSGRTLALPGDFTASAWTVTDGAIVTSSTTQLTIPDYPIGNELLAVSLTVAPGLGILAGDPITIADTATGLNSMTGYVTSYAIATGALVCQIGVALTFEISRCDNQWGPNDGYGSYGSFGSYSCWPAIIIAALGTDITIIDVGVIQVRIPFSQMQQLCLRTYQIGMTMTDSVDTRQILLGLLPILNGGVPPVTGFII